MRLIKKIRYKIYNLMNMDVYCRKDSFIKRGGVIGKNCEIFPDVEFGSEPYLIQIGNHVRITNGVRFVTHDGGMWTLRGLGLDNADVFGPITIGDNVHIGWNVIIMPNVHIGNNVVIGAGAVVTKDIPDNSIAVGVPAHVIQTIEEYQKKAEAKCDYTKNLSSKKKKEYLLNKFNKG